MKSTARQVAVATTSALAADAASEVAELGGNAIDCGVAAAMCSINTQPGVCALAGSAYVTIWDDGGDPVTIDGNTAVPGLGTNPGRPPEPEEAIINYGGGLKTLVGASSVAVPGTLAALQQASDRFGRLPWKTVMEPSVRAAREGFPLAAACRYYLGYAIDVIYQRSDDGHAALHDEAGRLLDAGDRVVVPHLADSLDAIAREGAEIFYRGELGSRVVQHVQERGGRLTREDMLAYEADIRPALMVDVEGWHIATNPPPAVGGANLAATWLRLIRTQEATMRYRKSRLDVTEDVSGPALEMLRLARSDDLISRYASGSTVHTSSVDDAGLACSITASSGYGSGEMPAGTGLWLNNCLGELELNLFGLDAGPPGRRLPSNMAPGCARSETAILAIGSPGADRITTALHQFLVNFLQLGLDLDEAVAHPRLHLNMDGDKVELAAEPGIEVPDCGFEVVRYDAPSMYFGGVVAAIYSTRRGFEVAADPRREGGTFVPGRVS